MKNSEKFVGEIYEVIPTMMHSEIKNYIVPGLSSFLIGGGGNGLVRMFACERNQHESVTPHSHRFGFICLVLSGRVRNRTWYKSSGGDSYRKTTVKYNGDPGKYERLDFEDDNWSSYEKEYLAGDFYRMSASEIHSITFDSGTEVLFFEGAEETGTTFILEPVVNGECIETLDVKPWMFQK